MRVAQNKKTFARTAHQSLNSNPKTLRQRKKTDNNRREPQRPLLDRIICTKTKLQVAWVSYNLYFFVPNAGCVIQTRSMSQLCDNTRQILTFCLFARCSESLCPRLWWKIDSPVSQSGIFLSQLSYNERSPISQGLSTLPSRGFQR
jgi:hypothetical protein